jgi:hypothetical protein
MPDFSDKKRSIENHWFLYQTYPWMVLGTSYSIAKDDTYFPHSHRSHFTVSGIFSPAWLKVLLISSGFIRWLIRHVPGSCSCSFKAAEMSRRA